MAKKRKKAAKKAARKATKKVKKGLKKASRAKKAKPTKKKKSAASKKAARRPPRRAAPKKPAAEKAVTAPTPAGESYAESDWSPQQESRQRPRDFPGGRERVAERTGELPKAVEPAEHEGEEDAEW